MEHQVTVLEGCEREVRLSLTETELRPHFEQAYVRAQAGISLPGFRKGKVPVAIIKQKFGRDIENEALETIADAEFRNFLKAEPQQVVGTPALTDIAKGGGGVSFTIRFEVMPDFTLGDYRNLVVQRPVKNVTDEDVEEEIDRIRLRAASFEPAEKVDGTRYVVTLTMNELDRETGMPIIGAEAKEERIFLEDENVDMHLRNSVRDLGVGDSISYVAETKDANEQPPSYRVTVADVQKVVPAELTDEFVSMITGGKISSESGLRDDIRQQLTSYYENEAKSAVENQIVEQLVQAHEFPVPHSLVHSVVHQLFEDFKKRNEGAPGLEKLTAHDLEEQLEPSAIRIVKWELIRDKVAAAENVSVTDEDIVEMSGKVGLTEDQLRMVMRQNRNVEAQLLAEKVVKTLVDYAVVNDVDVDQQQPVL